LKLTINKEIWCLSIITSVILVCFLALDMVSAQTFSPQQPPNFGDFNGTMPDFGGNFPGDSNGSSGFPGGIGPGGFNGTFGGFGDGNSTRPNFSGAPADINGAFNGQATGSQTDYSLIIICIVVAVVVVVVGVVVLRKKKSRKQAQPQAYVEAPASSSFDF